MKIEGAIQCLATKRKRAQTIIGTIYQKTEKKGI